MSDHSQSLFSLSTATLVDSPGYVAIHNDSSKLAKIHFDELQRFMGEHLANGPFNSQSIARERLSHLTTFQFQDLTIDVYDELIRRNNNTVGNEVPFLATRDDFDPKRNQARQKLCILSKSRLKDLVGDVLTEFGQRYPEFREPEVRARSQSGPPSLSPMSRLDPPSHKPLFLSTSTHPGDPDHMVLHTDSRTLAKIHFDELERFGGRDLDKEPHNFRSHARGKLTLLTKVQLHELAEDAYDELIRRNTNAVRNETPFLPVRDDIHTKRNQARQKLSTVTSTRFKDLTSDVLFELRRRYPEFHESEVFNKLGLDTMNVSRTQP